jgi:putative intracellular protease/amidase
MEVLIVAPELSPVTTFEGIKIIPDYSFENVPQIDVLVVPSAKNSMSTDLGNRELISFVSRVGEEAKYVMSLCDGAFVLAQAGLLEGKKCTTFPSDIKAFRNRFEDLDVLEGVSFVHDGRFITSAGGAKSFEAALYLVELLYGAKVARGIARGLVIDWDLTAVEFSGDLSVSPREPIILFNGKDLSNFYTWLVDDHREDPVRVFTVLDQVDGAPAIRVSGERWGGLTTVRSFRDYRLITEFKWGSATWGRRINATRDSGILLHCQGPDGNTGEDFNGPWMRSIESQIIEGGVGDFILVAGHDSDGARKRPSIKATVSEDRDGELIYDPNAPARRITDRRVNWFGRDPDWEDVLGFRGKQDVESPFGEWTRVEVVCDGDTITTFVNGKRVNAATEASLSSGRIQFQSEGAEIFFRKIELHPLD